jgi:hypothetical protein
MIMSDSDWKRSFLVSGYLDGFKNEGDWNLFTQKRTYRIDELQKDPSLVQTGHDCPTPTGPLL